MKRHLLASVAVVWCASVTPFASYAQTAGNSVTPEETNNAGLALARAVADASGIQVQITSIRRIGYAAVFCGMVNSKDESGNYLGYRQFVVLGSQAVVNNGRPDAQADFERLEQLGCVAP
jgi:hypothetical protein